jgi:transcriptional regulator with XRE-family HTH domain
MDKQIVNDRAFVFEKAVAVHNGCAPLRAGGPGNMDAINNIARNNIKIYRKMRRMTQKELADALEVTHSSVSAWEIGKNSIDLERLNEICHVLGITLAELLSENLSVETAVLNEENKKLVEYIGKRPEVKKLIDVTIDSRSSDVLVAITVLEALKRR